MTQETIAVLVEQRRELLRDLTSFQHEARRCEAAIAHVDATILLLAPKFDWSTVAPVGQPVDEVLFQPGEMLLVALNLLREANRSMSTAEILNTLLAQKGAGRLSAGQRRSLAKRLHALLAARTAAGEVRRAGTTPSGGMGRPALVVWECAANGDAQAATNIVPSIANPVRNRKSVPTKVGR